jgi:transcriptional regulator with XRE-family HTH domain
MPKGTGRARVSPSRRALGDRVRARRNDLGLTQEALAERARVHRTYVGGVERAKYDVGVSKLLDLADALGVDPGDLVRGLKP